VRPLLDFSRDEIAAQAARWNLDWIEDPANRQLRFDRSRLRAEVTPALRARWPAAHRAAVRLGRQMIEAETLLEELASADAAAIEDLARIPCAALRALGDARTGNLLRFAIRRLGLPTPSQVHEQQLRRAVRATMRAGATCVGWPGAEARFYRDRLYLMTRLDNPSPPSGGMQLTAGTTLQGAEGHLRLVTAPAGFPEEWLSPGLSVRYRVGGERFTPIGHSRSKALKQWFQENGVVPWMRDRIPLLFHADTLVGIGDLSISDEARYTGSEHRRWRAVWTDHRPVV
jgi:tRNA(Ile)-lysidine synthase